MNRPGQAPSAPSSRPPQRPATRNPAPASAPPPDNPQVEALLQRAFQDHGAGRLNEAAQGYNQVLKLSPGHADALHLLGLVMRAAGRIDDAVRLIEQAVAARPHWPDAFYNLGNALAALGRAPDAIKAYNTAIEQQPENPLFHYNLGNLKRATNDYKGAVLAFRRAVEADPNHMQSWHNLANVLRETGENRLAINIYRKVLSLDPDLAEAHYNLGLALMSVGELVQGFREYEWRWKVASFPSPRRNYDQPLWKGELLKGKTLLVHAEQGMGDTLQFCRYVPLLQRFGGRVLFGCAAPQMGLLSRLPGVSNVIDADGQSLARFDYHVPLLSLPRIFGTKVETIPAAVPYLTPDPQLLAKWRKIIGKQGLKIGLNWAGNPKHGNDVNRSMALRDLLAMPMAPGVRFFSLQKDEAAGQLHQLGLTDTVPDLGAQINDFDELAAAISALDLVITVDSAPAHMAGALGKPVWVFLPTSSDWRWMEKIDRSPWYPTMRLFRQDRQGSWAEPVQRAAAQMMHVARNGLSTLTEGD